MADWTGPVDALLDRLKAANWKERDAIKDELIAFTQPRVDDDLIAHLQAAAKGTNDLEVRWEIEAVVEAIEPKPEAEAPPEEPEQAEDEAPDDGRLRMSDLNEVYSDPRGIALFTDKSGERWFLSQVDPYTGQPMMQELPPGQVEAVKAQLKGSPYWRIGSGVAP